MHPQLIIHKHEGCEGVIEALDQCHKANSFNKFLGFCNDAKREVDQCLKEEFLAQRAENRGKNAEKRAKMKKVWQDIDEPSPEFIAKHTKTDE
ncbi:hypothetical protein [Absidia glauca]|uniref:COX assembly mitochondrial protein n=1 Tax=Absidia glauca TaxID=4829 RepID=A0A170APP1_ABSGL|nr:hypothetical protein [Absidia glauca]